MIILVRGIMIVVLVGSIVLTSWQQNTQGIGGGNGEVNSVSGNVSKINTTCNIVETAKGNANEEVLKQDDMFQIFLEILREG